MHDNVALIDIVDDCVRASARALRKGVTFGNNRSLYIILNGILHDECINRNIEPDVVILFWLGVNMSRALEDMAVAQLELLRPGKHLSNKEKRKFINFWYTHIVDVLTYRPNDKYEEMLAEYRRITDLERLDSVKQAAYSLSKAIEQCPALITQPVDTDISMLKRFGEVALKFALSGRIIISNSAYVKDEKKRR